ncbi:hypothetical protein Pelo_125 [Pelomyxa schiedti]|nr:hypothetical protein Pelo_125 [Pelomyxa schiedti]
MKEASDGTLNEGSLPGSDGAAVATTTTEEASDLGSPDSITTNVTEVANTAALSPGVVGSAEPHSLQPTVKLPPTHSTNEMKLYRTNGDRDPEAETPTGANTLPWATLHRPPRRTLPFYVGVCM